MGGRIRVGVSSCLLGNAVRYFPLLPVEDEERLGDPVVRERFIGKILADTLAPRPPKAGRRR